MKGGVGKTTLAVNISYVLANHHKKKVLLVDIDPQFNATQYLVAQQTILNHFKTKKTIYDVLMPKKEDEISLTSARRKVKDKPEKLEDFIINISKTSSHTFDLLPSSLKLINFETDKRGVENRLKKFLTSNCSHYDYILIDCPPTLSLLTLSAYLASEYYLIPIKPDYLSSLGLPLLERGLKEYEELHSHSLKLLGIVFTMVNRNKLTDEVMHTLKSSDWECFENHSTSSTRVARSVESLRNFYYYARDGKFSDEFKNITSELLNLL